MHLTNAIDLGNIHPTRPLGIFNQFAPPAPLRRSRNAFEEDDDDEDIEEMASFENGFRTRVRRVDADADGEEEFTVEETTGISNMTSTQSRLARLFQPPFDIIRNYDLDTVCFSSFLLEICSNLFRLRITHGYTKSGFWSMSKIPESSPARF